MQKITGTTNSSGDYSYSFSAPLTAGVHTLKAALTDVNGIYGENQTNFSVRIGISPSIAGAVTGTEYFMPDENFTLSAFVQNSSNGPIDSVWVNITKPGNTSSIYFIDNQTSRTSVGIWSKTFNVSELGNALGDYTAVFFANDSAGLGGQAPAPAIPFSVRSISVSGNISTIMVNPGESMNITGRVSFQPSLPENLPVRIQADGEPVSIQFTPSCKRLLAVCNSHKPGCAGLWPINK
jgi:hypothetical protein